MERHSGRGRLSGIAAMLGIGAALGAAPSLPELNPKRAKPKPVSKEQTFKLHHSTTGNRRGSKDEQLQRQVDAQAKRIRKGERRLHDWKQS